MDTPKAIVIAAAIIAVAIILTNLHKLEKPTDGAIIYRINTITGTVAWCAPRGCRSLDN